MAHLICLVDQRQEYLANVFGRTNFPKKGPSRLFFAIPGIFDLSTRLTHRKYSINFSTDAPIFQETWTTYGYLRSVFELENPSKASQRFIWLCKENSTPELSETLHRFTWYSKFFNTKYIWQTALTDTVFQRKSKPSFATPEFLWFTDAASPSEILCKTIQWWRRSSK